MEGVRPSPGTKLLAVPVTVILTFDVSLRLKNRKRLLWLSAMVSTAPVRLTPLLLMPDSQPALLDTVGLNPFPPTVPHVFVL